MAIRIVRLGSARAAGEGLRIGAVRFLPRGVPKSEYAARDLLDTWLPVLAPEPELIKDGRAAESEARWKAFARRYRAQMKTGDPARTLDLLAALSHQTDFSIGCYCAEEARCHRSLLRELLRERGAALA